MSSPDALATVTATLKVLLNGLVDNEDNVTTKPLSVARNGSNGGQINIFLYSTYYNAAFSNAPMPGATRSGEHAYPPLPLVLKYLITAYGANDDDISGQQLMGQAMSILHDHSVLGRSVIRRVFPESRLHEQVERIRITPDALSLDDMSKLWSSFQSAEYRLSTGYEVSVVLIESARASRAPLPVLMRGENDRGPDVFAAFSPSLSGLRFPRQKPSAELGDLVILLGENLTHDNTTVRLQHPRLKDPIDISPQPTQNATEMAVQLPTITEVLEPESPDLGSGWPAGFYKLTLLTKYFDPRSDSDTRNGTSNSLSLPLSPRIESINPASAPAGDVVLTVMCRPQVRKGQRVLLLFGDRMISPDEPVAIPADPKDPTTLDFTIQGAVAREVPYVLRLRVDGVDSIPVDFSGATPQFLDNQKVIIT